MSAIESYYRIKSALNHAEAELTAAQNVRLGQVKRELRLVETPAETRAIKKIIYWTKHMDAVIKELKHMEREARRWKQHQELMERKKEQRRQEKAIERLIERSLF